MTTEAQRIRQELSLKEGEYKSAKARVESLERNCDHQWSKTVYDPIVQEGYHFEGDPEGTMGIDRRMPSYIPRQEKARWKRVCAKCGKVDYTERTQEQIQKIPVF